MKELVDFLKGMLSTGTQESYTRGAGFTALYFYLLWATYKISGGAAMTEIDIPPVLAGFLFALYGFGEWSKRGQANANPGTAVDK